MTIEIIHLHAIIPNKNEDINPINNELIFETSKVQPKSKKDLIILPKISGSTIKNEKRADISRSIPNKTAIAIVDPLLEIPGKIATA